MFAYTKTLLCLI